MVAIRGAVFVDANTAEDIKKYTILMLNKIIEDNHLCYEEIISIIFSATNDLTKMYPAVAAREIGINNAALFCTQEMYVEGSATKCLRVLVHVEKQVSQQSVKHVYMNGAERLRPDLNAVFSIAIDGPAGAGKSTIAKFIAKRLNIVYIDTGAMYRTVGYHCLMQDIDINNPIKVEQELNHISISLSYEDGIQQIFLNDTNVSDSIRTSEASDAASKVSAYKPVRIKMVEMQQQLAKKTSVVLAGRDIGTDVLPNATLKIYLTASVDVRAKRRYDEAVTKGEKVNIDRIKADIEERDYRDMNRDVSPLRCAEDAVVVDTSNMNIDHVVDHIIKLFGDLDENNCS